MNPEDNQFLKEFYNAVANRPLGWRARMGVPAPPVRAGGRSLAWVHFLPGAKSRCGVAPSHRVDAATTCQTAAGQIEQALAQLGDRRVRLRAQALMLAARVKQAENDVETALRHLGEAVLLWRALLDEIGEMPQTLRDLAVALMEIGDLHMNVGDTTAAKNAGEESLALRRRIVLTAGGTPHHLRDLAVALNRVGDLHGGAGDTTAARDAYGESLALCRRLLAATGETPQGLRDLVVALGRLGDVHAAEGDAAAATAASDESSTVRRRLRVLAG